MRKSKAGGQPPLSDFLSNLNEAAERSTEYSRRHFRLLGILSIAVPLAYPMDLIAGNPDYDTFIPRLLAFLLSVPLVFHDRKPLRDAPWRHVYFVLLVAYVLPFTYGFILVANTASAPAGSQSEIFWVLQYVIALFLFIQLIHNGTLATVLWTISSIAATAPLAIIENVNWQELERVIIYPISAYITALFFGILTNRNVEYVNSEKLKAVAAVGGNVAHELRTPLATIRSLARAVRNHSETLAETYETAQRAGLHSGTLSRTQVTGLRNALYLIEQEVTYSNTVIDMLLLNTSGKYAYDQEREVFLVSSSILEAIDRYPFNNSDEKKLLALELEHDFLIHASKVLITHVFFNLLKNGIFYAQRSADPQVIIRSRSNGRSNQVDVWDSGPGISPANQKRIFERFFTTTRSGQGAGVGLSFCESVMEAIGGRIDCESEEGCFACFTLSFPKINPS